MSMLTATMLVVIGTALFSALLTFVFIHLGERNKWYDLDPHHIKIHRKVPTSGGLAIFISFWTMMLIVTPTLFQTRQHLGTFIASFIIVLVGLLDDRFEIKPWQKAIGILLAANIIYFVSDITFSTTLLPNVSPVIFNGLTYLFTIGWIFIVTNAINLLDGLDGLASSVTLISLITLIIITYFFSLSIPLTLITMLVILMAAIGGFLPFNWNPARIYLGDTGALFIGFMYAVLSVGHLKNATFYSLIVPFLIYVVPLFDTVYSILRRVIAGKSIVRADNDHIHHRLLRIGLTERQVVLVMIIITIVFSILAILTQLFQAWRQYILLFTMGLIVVMFMFMRQLSKRG